jgi:HEAT repeat protein
MDISAKKFVRLLKPDQPAEVRAAAITVLGELGVKDAEASAELLASLDDDSDTVRVAAIQTVGKLKTAKALPRLLERIKSGGEEANLSADAAAKLGAEGVKGLQALMHTVVPGVRRYIASALTSAAAGAEAGVTVLLDKDPQIATAGANAIIGRIPTLPPDRKAALVKELVSVASSKKAKLPPSSELSIVRVLASLNDPAAADALWDRTLPPHSAEVRALALQAVGGWAKNPTKEQWRRLFACAADTEFRVAAPALMILDRLPVSDKQLAEWVALLRAPDLAARRLAMEKVGDRDTADVAAALMEQLSHPDRGVRDAARTRLAKLDHGRKALAKAVIAATTTEEMWSLARSVAPFVGTFPTEVREQLFKQAFTFIEADDHRYDPLLFLLREADAAGLRDRIHDQGVARRKKKDYETALKYLKLVARDPAVGFPVRLELAMVGLKQSAKDVAGDARANDPCLRQFEHILGQNADEVVKTIEKAKWLDEEDLYYVGFHFAERFGHEKEFGAAMLKLVGKVAPRSKLAAAAKNKLKSVAAD